MTAIWAIQEIPAWAAWMWRSVNIPSGLHSTVLLNTERHRSLIQTLSLCEIWDNNWVTVKLCVFPPFLIYTQYLSLLFRRSSAEDDSTCSSAGGPQSQCSSMKQARNLCLKMSKSRCSPGLTITKSYASWVLSKTDPIDYTHFLTEIIFILLFNKKTRLNKMELRYKCT